MSRALNVQFCPFRGVTRIGPLADREPPKRLLLGVAGAALAGWERQPTDPRFPEMARASVRDACHLLGVAVPPLATPEEVRAAIATLDAMPARGARPGDEIAPGL